MVVDPTRFVNPLGSPFAIGDASLHCILRIAAIAAPRRYEPTGAGRGAAMAKYAGNRIQ